MKTAVRITVSLVTSTVLVFFALWIYLGHFLMAKVAEQHLSLVMWSCVGIGAALILGLTVIFYRVIR